MKDFYREYPLNMDVRGNYHDLARFFDKMRTRPRIFNVSGLKMRAAKSRSKRPDGQDHSITANFTALTFIYNEESDKPKPVVASLTKKKKKKKKRG